MLGKSNRSFLLAILREILDRAILGSQWKVKSKVCTQAINIVIASLLSVAFDQLNDDGHETRSFRCAICTFSCERFH